MRNVVCYGMYNYFAQKQTNKSHMKLKEREGKSVIQN